LITLMGLLRPGFGHKDDHGGKQGNLREGAIRALSWGYVEPEEGFEPSTFRLRDGCSASIWTATDGSSLLTLDGPSVQTAPDGYRRIVWMIKRMIKGCPTESDAKASK
jgi:hypothetical protein